jgi:hypothetical protein
MPISRKNSVTTLGVLKRTNLIRWEDVKGIDYMKPDARGKQKVKILHKTAYKNTTTELMFGKNDEQIDQFKATAKEYRNKKKKDKKSGN